MSGKSIVLTVVLALIVPLSVYPQELWTSKDGSIRDIDTRAVFVDGQRIYLATRTELYASNGSKNKWESIFFIPSGDNEISCVSGRSGDIVVGTRRGAFRSQDLGRTWRNVFKAIMPDKNIVLAVEMPSGAGKILIGTRLGLFVSDDGGARWRAAGGALKNRRVKCVALNNGRIYAGTDDGLYSAKDGLYDWQRIFVSTASPDMGDIPEEAPNPAEDGESIDTGINCIALKASRIYIGAFRKISYSDDKGESWNDLSSTGLSGDVKSIAASERSDKLYCATTNGVFEFDSDGNRWSELYKGMDKTVSARSIVFGSEDEKTLWAGTDRGLYKLEITNPVENQYIDVEKNLRTMKVIFDNEPSFKDLQAAAMKFNEVNPEKIRKWRTEARMRALVPKINMGFDNSRSNTYEIYTSATKDYVVAGPEDINEGFDVSISWDLADLIWSDDQTNIDVRSRLTTQLRNDILDDLRRAYFERKRLQYELISSPPMEAKLRFEKELRIQELTQAIDDITGNQLSENIHPTQEHS